MIGVRDALATVDGLIGQIGIAVRLTAGVALVAARGDHALQIGRDIGDSDGGAGDSAAVLILNDAGDFTAPDLGTGGGGGKQADERDETHREQSSSLHWHRDTLQ